MLKQDDTDYELLASYAVLEASRSRQTSKTPHWDNAIIERWNLASVIAPCTFEALLDRPLFSGFAGDISYSSRCTAWQQSAHSK